MVVYKITINGTVEERILRLQEQKRELAKAAVGDGAKGFKAGLTKLSLNDILDLFNWHDGHQKMGSGDAGSTGIVIKPRVLSPTMQGGTSGVRYNDKREVATDDRGRGTGRGGGGFRKEDPIFGRRW